MEGEFYNLIKIWISTYICLAYSYFAGKKLHSITTRIAAILPVICLFLLLPLQLKTTHLTGTTGFFLAWLANFKLLMFAFKQGPLWDPSLSFPKFIAIASLPIKLRNSNPEKNHETDRGSSSVKFAIKAISFAIILKFYDYSDRINPKLLMVIYSLHIYILLDFILAIAAIAARNILGVELEPQVNEPYLSSSLQDFWGRRWNLMVTRILRPTVYIPVMGWSMKIMDRKWASLPAVMSVFIVSGLMHEIIFYYFCRVMPTWEITGFFVLQGASLMVEILVKKFVNGRWQPPKVVGIFLTIGFVMITGFWLFFPPLLRCKADERALAEIWAVGSFLKSGI